MTASELVRRRRPDWMELERLLQTSGRRRSHYTPPEQISRFAALFRSACADLARARELGYPDDLVDYLNSLAARSHNYFYVAPPFPLGRIWEFFRHIFPAAVRRNAIYVAAGLLLFYGPMAAMIVMAKVDDTVVTQLVPRGTLKQFEKMYEASPESGRTGQDNVLMTGFYVHNNIGIAFRCFASGIFFGLGSIFVLLFNGIAIGAVVGFVSQTPSAMNLLSFIAGHGPFELTAIALAGAAGLRLGFGLVVTGNRRRSESLRLAAREAVLLVLGSAALLLAAALIEGFFSPSPLPRPVKIGFGAATALLLIWYLGLYRSEPRANGRRATLLARTAAGGGAGPRAEGRAGGMQ